MWLKIIQQSEIQLFEVYFLPFLSSDSKEIFCILRYSRNSLKSVL